MNLTFLPVSVEILPDSLFLQMILILIVASGFRAAFEMQKAEIHKDIIEEILIFSSRRVDNTY